MNLNGADVNFGRNIFRLNGVSLDYLLGFRYLYLNDTLTLDRNFTVLPGGAGTETFLGTPQPAGATFGINDTFNMTNRFYGGQIGLRGNWTACTGLDLGATVKIAFGNTAHASNIDGTTTLTAGGVTSTAPGGIYAQNSNIGNHGSNDFSVVSEISFTVGYQLHPNIRVIGGYTLLYWPRVDRAGEQIDRTISAGQAPTDPAFAAGTVGTSPRFLDMRRTSGPRASTSASK